MYGIYANMDWGILMVNVTIYNIHGFYGYITVYGYKYGNIDYILFTDPKLNSRIKHA